MNPSPFSLRFVPQASQPNPAELRLQVEYGGVWAIPHEDDGGDDREIRKRNHRVSSSAQAGYGTGYCRGMLVLG